MSYGGYGTYSCYGSGYAYGYADGGSYGGGPPGYRYGDGITQYHIREYGPGQYGPSGHAQYYGGPSAAGYAYYVLNTDQTTTYFAGGPGGPGGPPIYYGSYGSYT